MTCSGIAYFCQMKLKSYHKIFVGVRLALSYSALVFGNDVNMKKIISEKTVPPQHAGEIFSEIIFFMLTPFPKEKKFVNNSISK